MDGNKNARLSGLSSGTSMIASHSVLEAIEGCSQDRIPPPDYLCKYN